MGAKAGRRQEARDVRGYDSRMRGSSRDESRGRKPGRETRDGKGKKFSQSIILPGRIEGKETREKPGSMQREGI